MKILTSEQIYLADKEAIIQQKITSTDLMEIAAVKCFEYITKNFEIKELTIKLFCGVGNNGGDGLVIARLLQHIKAKLSIYVVHFSNNQSDDFKINIEKLKNLEVVIHHIYKEKDIPEIYTNDFVIDAIFGVGLKKSPFGFTKKLIQQINQSKAYVLSIDMPSGLMSESVVTDKESVIEANQILTFQTPKLAFLIPENQHYCQNFKILDIGLNQEFIENLASKYYFTTQKEMQKLYQPRNKFSHKGSYGHSLLIGGSYGKIGAITLASKAALKIGSGLVSCYLPKCGYQTLQTSIAEVMVEVDHEFEIHHFNFKTNPTIIGIGPGLGMHEKTIEGFLNFLKHQQNVLVIDADAINIVAQHNEALSWIPKNSVLTPHPKEFERLVGTWKDDFEKLDKLLEFSNKYQLTVVLKGAYTVIAHQNKLHFNSTGNAALATAGSGDVLTGMITSLIAQGYSPFQAALIGVYLHGKTAEIYSGKYPLETFIASDIIDLLPKAMFKTFYR